MNAYIQKVIPKSSTLYPGKNANKRKSLNSKGLQRGIRLPFIPYLGYGILA